MAAEPKRSFKRTVASTVEGRSPRFLLGSLALAMVLSILAGLGIGIKIGEHNKKKAKPAAATQTPTTQRAKRAATTATRGVQGVVVRTTATSLVLTSGKRQVTLGLVERSKIEILSAATASDIKAGSHVLLVLEKPAAGTTTTGATASAPQAREIIIVSGTSKGRIGTSVTAATSDSMSFKVGGNTVTVSTAGAKVSKTVAGTRTNLTAGAHVRIKTYLPPVVKKKPKVYLKRVPIAVEILVVPATSAFA